MITAEATQVRAIGHWINGQIVEDGQNSSDVFDPATGYVQARALHADASVVGRAVDAAQRSFQTWAATSLPRRTQVMYSFREALIARADELAAILTAEHGKTTDDAHGELARARESIEMACSAPYGLMGRHSRGVASGIDVHSVREPLGVCVGISPFNFPAMVPIWLFATALVAGNTFVLKPSELDPSASLLLAELLESSGLPSGVFNVVQGGRETTEELIDHPAVKAISFIGSTAVARAIHERGSRAGKRVNALGSAKNHMVVMPDADLAIAADAMVSAAYGSSGQRCMAVTTVVAIDPCGDALVARAAERVAKLRVGPGSEPEVDVAPVVTEAARTRITSLIEQGAAEGAEIVVDGRTEADANRGGFFVGPTLFDHVRPGMRVYDQEIFGPVLIVVRVASLDEAIKLVNTNPYGNGSAIFTASGWAAHRFETEVATGTVGINVPIPVPFSFYGFAGWKDSRVGTYATNAGGYDFYTREKVVSSRWDQPPLGLDLVFPNNA